MTTLHFSLAIQWYRFRVLLHWAKQLLFFHSRSHIKYRFFFADGDTSSRNLAMHILSIYTMHGEILSASHSFLTKVLPTLLEMIVEENDTFATESISLIDAVLQSQNAKAIYSCVALGVPTLMKSIVKQRSGQNKLVEELLLKLLRSQTYVRSHIRLFLFCLNN
jgi:hypothetical protein